MPCLSCLHTMETCCLLWKYHNPFPTWTDHQTPILCPEKRATCFYVKEHVHDIPLAYVLQVVVQGEQGQIFSHLPAPPSKPRARTVGLACGVQLSLKVNWFINSFRGGGFVLELSTISWKFSSPLLQMVNASTSGLTTCTVLRPFHHLFSLHAQRCQPSPDGPCSPVYPGQPLLTPSLLLDPLSQLLFLLQHQQVLPGRSTRSVIHRPWPLAIRFASP